MSTVEITDFRPIYWDEGKVRLIDQTRLPAEELWLELADYKDVVDAIKQMRIRGAPAIGVAGAYAMALAAQRITDLPPRDFLARLMEAAQEIIAARPTGANLAWAVQRVLGAARDAGSPETMAEVIASEAIRVQEEDEAANRRMGRYGAELIPNEAAVLTHCNTGALATGGYGTALGIIRTAWDDGRLLRVFATETRPLLQGARLTAWELARAGIETTLIPDSTAGHLMRNHLVQAVVVGADRIAANGDVVNKIGTYSLAVLSKEHSVPFYVAAPTSTIDMSQTCGDWIPIECRNPEEVTHSAGQRVAAEGVDVLNAAFDLTPHDYVTAIITERGVVREPYHSGLSQIMEDAGG